MTGAELTTTTIVVDRTYSTSEVSRLTGLTPRQLDYWIQANKIRPSGIDTQRPGSGHHLRWTADDVLFLRQVRARLAFGFTVEAAFRHRDPVVTPPPADRRLMPMEVPS